MTSLQVSGKQLTHKIRNVARPALRRLEHVSDKIKHSACSYVELNSVGWSEEENIFYLKKRCSFLLNFTAYTHLPTFRLLRHATSS